LVNPLHCLIAGKPDRYFRSAPINGIVSERPRSIIIGCRRSPPQIVDQDLATATRASFEWFDPSEAVDHAIAIKCGERTSNGETHFSTFGDQLKEFWNGDCARNAPTTSLLKLRQPYVS